ncbi:MAG: response regulator [Anaerolineae bacterium]|nr:response regulator [Anaerolineae bacterium]
MLDTITCLYVEDDPMSREAIRVILTRVVGVKHLTVFEDSANFMARLKALENQPDLILLDIHMTPFTGFEMLAMLRNDPAYQSTRVVALTASVMNEEVELLKRSGFDGVIGKPINVASFPRLLERVAQGESIWYITDDE